MTKMQKKLYWIKNKPYPAPTGILERRRAMSRKRCTLCPRACGADRTAGPGYCGAGALPRVGKVMLHHWEEPVLSGQRGAGAVFFSGCPLRCCYCQNYTLSAECFGLDISVHRLAEIFLELQEQGAHNLDLVSPTQYTLQICEALDLARPALTLPVVWNTGGYETTETIALLEGYVDIYLADCKYRSPALADRYSAAPDYFDMASAALQAMFRQVGPVQYGPDGLLRRGLLVRHLVLPGQQDDSKAVLRWLAAALPPEAVLISLMSQFTPFHQSERFPELHRRLQPAEYEAVLEYYADLGLQGFVQELSSAREEYTPTFDLAGVASSKEGADAVQPVKD